MKQPKPPTTVLSVRVTKDLADRVPRPVQEYLLGLIKKDQELRSTSKTNQKH